MHKYFSHWIVYFLFYVLCRNLLVWCGPTCLYLFLSPLFLVSNPKKYCKGQSQGACLLSSFLGILYFWLYIQVFKTLWVDFSIWCKWGSSLFHYFVCSYLVFPAFMKKITCPYCKLYSSLKIDSTWMGFFLGSQFCFTGPCVSFYDTTTLF